jgi:segregation and condensation protein B
MYGTTKFFLEHFGLQDITQLPPLREFKELGEAEQALLPMEQEPMPQDDVAAAAEPALSTDPELAWESQSLIPEAVEQS